MILQVDIYINIHHPPAYPALNHDQLDRQTPPPPTHLPRCRPSLATWRERSLHLRSHNQLRPNPPYLRLDGNPSQHPTVQGAAERRLRGIFMEEDMVDVSGIDWTRGCTVYGMGAIYTGEAGDDEVEED